MKHLNTICIMVLFWVLIYFLFAFLSWNINLITEIIESIPKKGSTRFILLIWIVVNAILYPNVKELVH